MSAARTLLAAAVVTVAAFLLYHATLLPGQDLGDTASFQATAGASFLTPRQAYPLYYATGDLFVAALPGDPARALNLASAVFGALACGLLAIVVAWLSGWALAGLAAGLLLAASYTFWSQAIIAEVYALHAFMMGLCFVALLLWTRRPTLPRLALFFGLYALGFGNHLSMVLLLPGFALYLLLLAPGGPRSMIRPRVAVLAIGLAALGAAQYSWNLRYLLEIPNRDPRLLEVFRDFWFDTTKADWRATMVMGIPEQRLHDRLAMYWFDVQQQFGLVGIALAIVGLAWILWPTRLPATVRGSAGALPLSRTRLGVALVVLFLVNWFFAFTYNVGDTHVFYLPAHFMLALFAGLGVGAVLTATCATRHAAGDGRQVAHDSRHGASERRQEVFVAGQGTGGAQQAVGESRSVRGGVRSAAGRRWAPSRGWRIAQVAIGTLLVAYPAWRAYDTLPALDRSHDWQVKEFFDRLTHGLRWDKTILATDLNWQLHNGMDYYAKYTRPDLGVVDTVEALLYFPLLVQSNREIGRDVAVTDGGAAMLRTAYGPLFRIERDARVEATSFAERVGRFSRGTPYALTLLAPYPDKPVDAPDLAAAFAWLTGGTVAPSLSTRYIVIAGRVGQEPTSVRASMRPFRVTVRAGDVDADVRMECWLPADTIRRMGFGRVIVGRAPALTLDRGVSFVAFDERGRVVGVEYGWTLLSPQPRWRIPLGP